MQLVIRPDGTVHCLYTETIDIQALGSAAITRASHVEPTPEGTWLADLSPADGPTLGPFPCRSQALAAECEWLEAHRL